LTAAFVHICTRVDLPGFCNNPLSRFFIVFIIISIFHSPLIFHSLLFSLSLVLVVVIVVHGLDGVDLDPE
jgi:hypothetical protein